MVFRGVYIIWFLLPLIYGFLTVWVFLRPYFKVSGKEKVATYSGSFVYTAICFGIAIALDQMNIMDPVAHFLGGQGFNTESSHMNIIRLLIYPVVLVVGAKIQQYMKKETRGFKQNLPKSKWDM